MARYIYTRVSTQQQDYAQQRNTIDTHLRNNRIEQSEIDSELVEKITGVDEHTNRKFATLFGKCKEGDIIYFSELSRIGRNMADLNNIVHEACERGIILIQCKDGLQIEDKTIGGKAILFALSLAAEMEVSNLHQRVRSGVSVAISDIKKNGHRITKRGSIQTHWGNQKGCDLSAAHEAAVRSKQDSKIAWQKSSIGYRWALTQIAKGKSRNTVIAEFNELHQQQPTVYCTRQGKPLTASVLSRWISQSNPLAI